MISLSQNQVVQLTATVYLGALVIYIFTIKGIRFKTWQFLRRMQLGQPPRGPPVDACLLAQSVRMGIHRVVESSLLIGFIYFLTFIISKDSVVALFMAISGGAIFLFVKVLCCVYRLEQLKLVRLLELSPYDPLACNVKRKCVRKLPVVTDPVLPLDEIRNPPNLREFPNLESDINVLPEVPDSEIDEIDPIHPLIDNTDGNDPLVLSTGANPIAAENNIRLEPPGNAEGSNIRENLFENLGNNVEPIKENLETNTKENEDTNKEVGESEKDQETLENQEDSVYYFVDDDSSHEEHPSQVHERHRDTNMKPSIGISADFPPFEERDFGGEDINDYGRVDDLNFQNDLDYNISSEFNDDKELINQGEFLLSEEALNSTAVRASSEEKDSEREQIQNEYLGQVRKEDTISSSFADVEVDSKVHRKPCLEVKKSLIADSFVGFNFSIFFCKTLELLSVIFFALANLKIFTVLLVGISYFAYSGDHNGSIPTLEPSIEPTLETDFIGPPSPARLTPRTFLDSKSYLDLLAEDSDIQFDAESFYYSRVLEVFEPRTSSWFPTDTESTAVKSISSFFNELQLHPKVEKFCHSLLSKHRRSLLEARMSERNPVIFAGLWQACAVHSIFVPANRLPPLFPLEVKIKKENSVGLEEIYRKYTQLLPNDSFILPRDFFMPPSNNGARTELAILHFIKKSDLDSLLDSIDFDLITNTLSSETSTSWSWFRGSSNSITTTRLIQAALFEKLLLERPFGEGGNSTREIPMKFSLLNK